MNTERTRHRVLVADDNVDAAETLGMLLRLAGQDVVVVHGGVAAIEQALASATGNTGAGYRHAGPGRIRGLPAAASRAADPERGVDRCDGLGPGCRPDAFAGSGIRPSSRQAGGMEHAEKLLAGLDQRSEPEAKV